MVAAPRGQTSIGANAWADLLEKIFVGASLFIFTGAVVPLLNRPGGVYSVAVDADATSSAIRGFVYAVSAALAFRYREPFVRALLANVAVIAASVFAGISVAWSVDPSVTARAAALLVATTLFGAYVGVRFSAAEVLRMMTWVLGAVLLASLLFVYGTSLGIQPGDYNGAWRGAFTHKNILGKTAALALAVFWLTRSESGRWRAVSWLLIAASAAACVLAKSVGSIVTAGLTVGIVVALPALRTRRVGSGRVAVIALIVLLAVAAVVGWQFAALVKLLGRDPTLTGRSVLWGLVVVRIAEHPWLGYGYNAFWHGRAALYLPIWNIVGWEPPHAHNGFLNIALDIGIVGVGIFLVGLLAAVLRAFRWLRTSWPTAANAWPLVYLAYFVASNLAEVSFLQYSNVFWILYIATAIQTRRRIAPADASGAERSGTPDTGGIL